MPFAFLDISSLRRGRVWFVSVVLVALCSLTVFYCARRWNKSRFDWDVSFPGTILAIGRHQGNIAVETSDHMQYRNTVFLFDPEGHKLRTVRGVLTVASVEGQNYNVLLQVDDDGTASVHLEHPALDGHWRIGTVLDSDKYGGIPKIVIAEGVLVAVFDERIEYALPEQALQVFPCDLGHFDRQLIGLDGKRVVIGRESFVVPPSLVELDFETRGVRHLPIARPIDYLQSIEGACGYMLFEGERIEQHCAGATTPILEKFVDMKVWRIESTEQCFVVGQGNTLVVAERDGSKILGEIPVLHGILHSAGGGGCCVDSVDSEERITRYDGRAGQKKSIRIGPLGGSLESGISHTPAHILSLEQHVLFDDGDTLTSVAVPHADGRCF